jgi:hypothetical protein
MTTNTWESFNDVVLKDNIFRTSNECYGKSIEAVRVDQPHFTQTSTEIISVETQTLTIDQYSCNYITIQPIILTQKCLNTELNLSVLVDPVFNKYIKRVSMLLFLFARQIQVNLFESKLYRVFWCSKGLTAALCVKLQQDSTSILITDLYRSQTITVEGTITSICLQSYQLAAIGNDSGSVFLWKSSQQNPDLIYQFDESVRKLRWFERDTGLFLGILFEDGTLDLIDVDRRQSYSRMKLLGPNKQTLLSCDFDVGSEFVFFGLEGGVILKSPIRGFGKAGESVLRLVEIEGFSGVKDVSISSSSSGVNIAAWTDEELRIYASKQSKSSQTFFFHDRIVGVSWKSAREFYVATNYRVFQGILEDDVLREVFTTPEAIAGIATGSDILICNHEGTILKLFDRGR